MIFIEYIGPKPVKTDNVAMTSTVWNGAGDIQPVDERVAAKLLAHPTIWRQTYEPTKAPVAITEPEPPHAVTFSRVIDGEGSVFRVRDNESDEITDLSELDDNAVKTFARVNGIKADLRKRGDELRAVVMAAAITE